MTLSVMTFGIKLLNIQHMTLSLGKTVTLSMMTSRTKTLNLSKKVTLSITASSMKTRGITAFRIKTLSLSKHM